MNLPIKNGDLAVCQNLVPLVNIKIAGKWMFIPLKMVLIGIDPYPFPPVLRCQKKNGAPTTHVAPRQDRSAGSRRWSRVSRHRHPARPALGENTRIFSEKKNGNHPVNMGNPWEKYGKYGKIGIISSYDQQLIMMNYDENWGF